MVEPDSELRALVVDYGGVLTSPLPDAMRSWCEADGIDHRRFRAVMREWLETDPTFVSPAHALERGEVSAAEFEQTLAAALCSPGGTPVAAEGLLTRMFAGFRAAMPMVEIVKRVKATGVHTALLSNSWGLDYDRDGWESLFDVVVISGEVGMRKPEPQIYELTAHKLGVAPSGCVFVDDLAPNIRGAADVGMVGVHHVNAEETIAELEALFGLDLAVGA